MLKDITLGQFFPGDTLAHKLDPRTKLNVPHYQTRDYLVLGYYAVLVAAVIALR